MPEDFTVACGAGQGELEVGGVFLRIFIAQPGWVLRKPREFLVSLLETVTELLEKNNPNVSCLTDKTETLFIFSLIPLTYTSNFTSSWHLWSPAGWGPGDSYHGSSMSVQHTEPAGRPGSSSGSPASHLGSTQPQEQRCAQELYPPHPRAIRQWGAKPNIYIVDFFNFQDYTPFHTSHSLKGSPLLLNMESSLTHHVSLDLTPSKYFQHSFC